MSPKSDILFDRKCIHVRINKDTHAEFRKMLFEHGLSMQEVFDEFAAFIVMGNPSATRVIEMIKNKKIRAALEDAPKLRKRKSFGELDSEALYDLIREDEEESNEESPRKKPGDRNEAA